MSNLQDKIDADIAAGRREAGIFHQPAAPEPIPDSIACSWVGIMEGSRERDAARRPVYLDWVRSGIWGWSCICSDHDQTSGEARTLDAAYESLRRHFHANHYEKEDV